MRVAHTAVAAALLGAVSLPTLALAQPVTGTATVAVDLNLRVGPGPEYYVITAIPANTDVTVFGCNEGLTWCDVDYNGVRGWSYAAYLIYGGPTATPLPTPAPIPEVTVMPPPVVVYNPEQYFDQNYQTQPFYNDRARLIGAAGGVGAGATIGALVFGPIGAAVGAAIGATVGAAIVPPPTVITYVQQQPPPQPVFLTGEVVIGAGVPDVVTLTPIPDYEYPYAMINGQMVLVDPTTRNIVYVFR
ncbi:MAG: DUF1236 domain-containing protein [Bauldia sp.]